MKWATSISQEDSLEIAIKECAEAVMSQLAPESADLLIAFVSKEHQDQFEKIPELIRCHMDVQCLTGCSGGGVIGGGKEVEDGPALSLTGAYLPGVKIQNFYLDHNALPSLDDDPRAWENMLKVSAKLRPHFIILSDPFSINSPNLLLGLDYAFKESVKIGGLASGGLGLGDNALFNGKEVHRSGAVGIAMSGNVKISTIVAQGCRPIGKPFIVSKSQRNILMELDGKKPLDVVGRMYEEVNDEDRNLMSTALHIGVVMDPLQEEFRAGDFLIRNVIGVHEESGALVVGEILREGQVVQFHVRDSKTAKEDLEILTDRYVRDNGLDSGVGALLFSCMGRGQHLFGKPNHDSDLFHEKVSPMPMGGFFCNGEIGQVGGTTFLHGFTSSFGIFNSIN